jgi:hypothetical protein
MLVYEKTSPIFDGIHYIGKKANRERKVVNKNGYKIDNLAIYMLQEYANERICYT